MSKNLRGHVTLATPPCRKFFGEKYTAMIFGAYRSAGWTTVTAL